MSHILCIGAHPDDNELCVGGAAARMRLRGDEVRFVSVTNGDRGHYDPIYVADPAALAARRKIEAGNAVRVIGASYHSLGVRDGEVYVDRPTTEAMIRCIRSFGEPGKGPDLVLFNRPQDYHRDHRYASQLVLDATYMLTVPTMCPETRHLDRMPVFAYWHDNFKEVLPFRADIAVAIDDVLATKVEMVRAHESQFFEWLPYNTGRLESVPPAADIAARTQMIREAVIARDSARADAVRSSGACDVPAGTRLIEAFQLCEYGRRPGRDELRELFPA